MFNQYYDALSRAARPPARRQHEAPHAQHAGLPHQGRQGESAVHHRGLRCSIPRLSRASCRILCAAEPPQLASCKLTSLHCQASCYGCDAFQLLRCRRQAAETREVDADYNPDFLRHIYPRIDWPTLRTAAETLGAGLAFCLSVSSVWHNC